MTQIKAAVCHQFGTPLRIETVELRAPNEAEVEVKLGAVAVCHSDISYAEGAWGGTLPAVYGHEAAGLITKIGKGVIGLCVGDHVVVTMVRACGRCSPCGSGRPSICEAVYDKDNGPLSTEDGGVLEHGLNCGAFAEKVVVDHSQVVKIPDHVSFDVAALLACGVITGIGAVVNSANVRPGQDVVVIGAGGVGLNTIQGSRLAGARRIIAIDMTEEKLQVAREFGATDGILATEVKPWKAAKAVLGRGADAVFVTVGAIPAYDTASRYLAYGGQIVVVGMPKSGEKSYYEPVLMSAVGQGLIGSKLGDVVIKRDIPWMVDLYHQGRLKLDELISKRFTLEQINDAFIDTKSGSARRNIIVFDV